MPCVGFEVDCREDCARDAAALLGATIFCTNVGKDGMDVGLEGVVSGDDREVVLMCSLVRRGSKTLLWEYFVVMCIYLFSTF